MLQAIPLIAVAHDSEHEHQYIHSQPAAQLVRLVRNTTEQFIDVNDVTTFGYGPFSPA